MILRLELNLKSTGVRFAYDLRITFEKKILYLYLNFVFFFYVLVRFRMEVELELN